VSSESWALLRHIQMERHTLARSEQVCPRGFWFGYTRRPEQGPFYSTADYPDTPGAGTEGEEAGIFLSAKRYDDVNEY
jgi:hypothetical protein